MSNAGGDARALVIHGIFWTLVLLFFEFNPLNYLCANFTLCFWTIPKKQKNINKDEDVINEAKRIADM